MERNERMTIRSNWLLMCAWRRILTLVARNAKSRMTVECRPFVVPRKNQSSDVEVMLLAPPHARATCGVRAFYTEPQIATLRARSNALPRFGHRDWLDRSDH